LDEVGGKTRFHAGRKIMRNPTDSTQEDIDFDNLPPISEIELKWVSAHMEELQEKYGGQWIVVSGERLIAHAVDLGDTNAEIEAQGIENPFVMYIPLPDEEPPVIAL
jgi:uncharacterized protein DUF5678